MSSNSSAKKPIIIPAEKKQALLKLTTPPTIAWPTVMIGAFVVISTVTVDVLALNHVFSLWTAMCLNAVFMYPVFHVIHDALHRAAAKDGKLNDLIGRIPLLFVAPHITMDIFRYSHMLHHRLTNDPKDPDQYVHGPWWNIVFRWMTFDIFYVVYNLRSEEKRGRQLVKEAVPGVLVVALLAAVLTYMGYGKEVLMLWFIPSRITTALIACVFLWMPHVDSERHNGQLAHIQTEGSRGDNLTAGTTIRQGHEGFLDGLMQWHNYHLIHHLWPTTPSYNHRAVWRLLEPELRARELRIQHGFKLVPTFHPAGTTAVTGI